LIETAAWLEDNGSEQLMASFYARLAEMLAADGQRERARHYAACALKRVRQGDCLGAGAALRALARLEAEREDGGRSERYLRRALRAAQSRDARPDAAITTLCAAEIALARGAPEKAAVLLDQASPVFEELEMRRHTAEAARLRARIEAA
jgi:ATP/maltotriose-dependent transcriptional regulator MalT